MEEAYTQEFVDWQAARTKALLQGLDAASRRAATELMSISFRAGKEAGRREVPLAVMMP